MAGLAAKHPEVFTVSADEMDAWHRHEAWRCESQKDWSNAVHHLPELLKAHPDSGDFLPRRAAACVAWAEQIVERKSELRVESVGAAPPISQPSTQAPLNFTNLLERALADYNRTLAWVDRFPARRDRAGACDAATTVMRFTHASR